MKIRPVGTELFHADGQNDMTELIITFRNFANAPKQQRQTCVLGVHVLLIVTTPHRKTHMNTVTTITFYHSGRNTSGFACQTAATPKPVAAFLR
jgi:hypothetical protein